MTSPVPDERRENVSEVPDWNESDTHLSRRINGGHWLLFDADRLVGGCHCGFAADIESDAGYGDSVLDHFEDVIRAEMAAELGGGA